MRLSISILAIAAPVAVISAAVDTRGGSEVPAIAKRDVFSGIWEEPGATERVANITAGVVKDPFSGLWEQPGAAELLNIYVNGWRPSLPTIPEEEEYRKFTAGINFAIKQAIDSYHQ